MGDDSGAIEDPEVAESRGDESDPSAARPESLKDVAVRQLRIPRTRWLLAVGFAGLVAGLAFGRSTPPKLVTSAGYAGYCSLEASLNIDRTGYVPPRLEAIATVKPGITKSRIQTFEETLEKSPTKKLLLGTILDTEDPHQLALWALATPAQIKNRSSVVSYLDASGLFTTVSVADQSCASDGVNAPAPSAFVSTIHLNDSPASFVVDAAGKYAYLAYNDDPGGLNKSNGIEVVDIATTKIVANIPIFGSPKGVALAPDGQHLLVARECNEAPQDITAADCPNSVAVVSTKSDKVTGSIDVGGVSSTVMVSPDGKDLYVWLSDGGLKTVDLATDHVVNTAFTKLGPFPPDSVTLSPSGGTMYALMGEVSSASKTTGPQLKILDLRSHTVTTTVEYSASDKTPPSSVVVSADGDTVYETFTSGRLDTISPRTGKVEQSFANPDGLSCLAPSRDGKFLYFGENLGVQVFSTATDRVVSRIAIRNVSFIGPSEFAFSNQGRVLFVLDDLNSNLNVVKLPASLR